MPVNPTLGVTLEESAPLVLLGLSDSLALVDISL